MNNCTLCPRNCRVDRTMGEKGICAMTDKILVSRAGLHMWEEPCISGNNGSGTVFFSGCSLKCVYCQNFNVSRGIIGKEVSEEKLSDIFLNLQRDGALNINLVTADHYVLQIIKALDISKSKGLTIPVIFNTSSYINEKTIDLLNGYIDIYLADFKYISSDIAKKYSNAENYPEIAKKAIDKMINQITENIFDEKNIMKKGIIVRNLVLPGYVLESKKILKYLYEKYGDKIYISIMSQFTPFGNVQKYPELNRKVTKSEYNRVVDYSIDLGIKNAFIQDGSSADESFIPEFNSDI